MIAAAPTINQRERRAAACGNASQAAASVSGKLTDVIAVEGRL